MRKLLSTIVALLLLPGSLVAQDPGSFDWKIAPYLWTVGIDGTATIGQVEQDMDISFSDILSDFEIGGSIFAEIGKGNHSAHFDYTYIRLKPDPNPLPTPPFPPDSTMATKLTINIFEPAYGSGRSLSRYRNEDDPRHLRAGTTSGVAH
jgi:hypothetical protein